MTNAEIARRVNLSTPGLQKRLKKLEKARVIEGYVTRVNRKALGLDLLCFVQVSLTPQQQPERMGQFCDRMQCLSEVLECHHLTGELDYLMKVVVTTPGALPVRNHRPAARRGQNPNPHRPQRSQNINGVALE